MSSFKSTLSSASSSLAGPMLSAWPSSIPSAAPAASLHPAATFLSCLAAAWLMPPEAKAAWQPCRLTGSHTCLCSGGCAQCLLSTLLASHPCHPEPEARQFFMARTSCAGLSLISALTLLGTHVTSPSHADYKTCLRPLIAILCMLHMPRDSILPG